MSVTGVKKELGREGSKKNNSRQMKSVGHCFYPTTDKHENTALTAVTIYNDYCLQLIGINSYYYSEEIMKNYTGCPKTVYVFVSRFLVFKLILTRHRWISVKEQSDHSQFVAV